MNSLKPNTKTRNQHNLQNGATGTRPNRLRRRLGLGLLVAVLCGSGTLQAGGTSSSKAAQLGFDASAPQVGGMLLTQSIATPPLSLNKGDTVVCNVSSKSNFDQTVVIRLHIQDLGTGDLVTVMEHTVDLHYQGPMARYGVTSNTDPALVFCEFEVEGDTTSLRGAIEVEGETSVRVLSAM